MLSPPPQSLLTAATPLCRPSLGSARNEGTRALAEVLFLWEGKVASLVSPNLADGSPSPPQLADLGRKRLNESSWKGQQLQKSGERAH